MTFGFALGSLLTPTRSPRRVRACPDLARASRGLGAAPCSGAVVEARPVGVPPAVAQAVHAALGRPGPRCWTPPLRLLAVAGRGAHAEAWRAVPAWRARLRALSAGRSRRPRRPALRGHVALDTGSVTEPALLGVEDAESGGLSGRRARRLPDGRHAVAVPRARPRPAGLCSRRGPRWPTPLARACWLDTTTVPGAPPTTTSPPTLADRRAARGSGGARASSRLGAPRGRGRAIPAVWSCALVRSRGLKVVLRPDRGPRSAWRGHRRGATPFTAL